MFFSLFNQNQKGMHEEFFTGTAKSIWCTFVSMATVGYGDVSPVTFVGRLIMTSWIVMSLFLVGIMTSMISDTVMGDSSFSVGNEKIAVVQDSVAERLARNYNAQVVKCKTYDEVGNMYFLPDFFDKLQEKFDLDINQDIGLVILRPRRRRRPRKSWTCRYLS